ncbi:hypothetical protein [Winogradskyella schleiferi]|uniref:hypothetical protein n=1 Tax=Winogradskyella schleiferi TaxID=2686078 RepID=UPI0015BBA8B8|nr:hypothetical protein [Winogradskyella schleiferi]
MNQDSEKYYLFFEEWHMDPNQWSMLIDGIAVLLAIIGVLIGFFIYRKQRKDNSQDAYDFFQSSLPELIESIEKAIVDLKEFNRSLDLDSFYNPILSASLNDKFLTKINLVHLNRYYHNSKKEKLPNFKQLLIDSNFFGNYHAYISKEINYFRTHYQENKHVYSKWRLFRSRTFFSALSTESEPMALKKIYTDWVTDLNQQLSDDVFDTETLPLENRSEEVHVENRIKLLAQAVLPFVKESQSANKVIYRSHKIISAYNEMTEMKTKIRNVLEKDILRFEKALSNMRILLK